MQKPFLIGLTGASGSGKTTFIHDLLSKFSKDDICVVSQDNYYRPREEQEQDAQGVVNFDLPTSINREEFARDIKKLINNETVYRQEYTFNNPLKEPTTLIFEPKPIILLEGIFIFHYEEISSLLDLKVFLHAKETTALSRRIKRDRLERNYPLEDVLYRYEHHVLPTYERFIKPFQYEADIIINNSQTFDTGLAVITGFLENHLRKQNH